MIDHEWNLSIMIERDEVCFIEHEARLRELVDARSAQLRLWLETKSATRKLRKEVQDCLHEISQIY